LICSVYKPCKLFYVIDYNAPDARQIFSAKVLLLKKQQKVFADVEIICIFAVTKHCGVEQR
jgi:hypothetical protein